MAVVPFRTSGSTSGADDGRDAGGLRDDRLPRHRGARAGRAEGEGLGNQFLGNIRETDAIVHVVRAHDDSNVVHPEGSVDPVRDIDTIETELIYADLEQSERRLERVTKQATSLDPAAVAEERWLRDLVERSRRAGRRARCRRRRTRPTRCATLQPLTSKPVLYVANVSEDGGLEAPAEVAGTPSAPAPRRWR